MEEEQYYVRFSQIVNYVGTVVRPYYCQVQLGMYVTGLKNCHFVIYCSYDSSIYALNIPYDGNLVQNIYLPTLRNVYFKHILRILTIREKENTLSSQHKINSSSDGKSCVGLLKKSVK